MTGMGTTYAAHGKTKQNQAVKPTVAKYLRISDEDADMGQAAKTESDSIANQRNLLTEFISRMPEFDGAEVIEFCDDGWSETNFERPDFKRIIADIESGRINTVITKDFSRLGRDYLQTGYYTDVYFPGKKVRCIAISDGIDTSTGYNEIAPFKNLFNDFYARDISKKIRSTMKTKARAGICLV